MFIFRRSLREVEHQHVGWSWRPGFKSRPRYKFLSQYINLNPSDSYLRYKHLHHLLKGISLSVSVCLFLFSSTFFIVHILPWMSVHKLYPRNPRLEDFYVLKKPSIWDEIALPMDHVVDIILGLYGSSDVVYSISFSPGRRYAVVSPCFPPPLILYMRGWVAKPAT